MATWSAGLDALLHDASLVYLGLFLAALIDATGRRHGPAGSTTS
jgi:hypothetical protein